MAQCMASFSTCTQTGKSVCGGGLATGYKRVSVIIKFRGSVTGCKKLILEYLALLLYEKGTFAS